MKRRTAVLISGRGSNMQALIDASADRAYPADIALVIANVPGAPGLERARDTGIPAQAIPHQSYSSREAFDAAMHDVLFEHGIELVCLAGFTRILSDDFVRGWEGRIINIHPSLLPAFKGLHGLRVHRSVLASGVRISGCTVHFVVPELDSGPIIAQAAVPVLVDDSEASLAARTLDAEHKLYPLALGMLASGIVRLADGKTAWREAPNAAGELFSPSP